MKICITAEEKTLEAKVDARFGRCRFFIFFDLDTGNFEVQENPHAQLQGGAGIQAGQLAAAKGIKAVLTGNIGPNAQQVLSASGIKIYTGVSGIVREAISKYREGKYIAAEGPSVGSKFGMPGK